MRHLIAFLSLIALLSACSKREHAPSPPPDVKTLTAVTSPIPTPAAPTPSSKMAGIARLTRFKPRVNYKKNAELSWQAVEPQLEFERHDSVQTQSNASAQIRYSSGSTLSLQENTLVVIDENSKPKRVQQEDRAYVDVGHVEGRTAGELWILTSAGMIKLKAKNKTEPATASISAARDKTVKIILNEGQAALLTKNKTNTVTAQTLTLHQEVVSKPHTTEVRISPDPPTWNSFAKVAKTTEVEPEELQKITLTEPIDQSVISGSHVWIKGKLNRAGGKLLVNGKSIPIEIDQTFKTSIMLVLGANVVSIQLIRVDGTTEFKRVTVIQKTEQKKPNGPS